MGLTVPSFLSTKLWVDDDIRHVCTILPDGQLICVTETFPGPAIKHKHTTKLIRMHLGAICSLGTLSASEMVWNLLLILRWNLFSTMPYLPFWCLMLFPRQHWKLKADGEHNPVSIHIFLYTAERKSYTVCPKVWHILTHNTEAVFSIHGLLSFCPDKENLRAWSRKISLGVGFALTLTEPSSACGSQLVCLLIQKMLPLHILPGSATWNVLGSRSKTSILIICHNYSMCRSGSN